MVAPVLIMMAGMGIEVNHWTVVKQELQRTADLAALAGAAEYGVTFDSRDAANVAANLAELNGMTGATVRIWSPSNRTLTDNRITVQVGPGVRDSTKTGVSVAVTQTVPLAFTKVMSSLTSMTIGATGWAQAASVQPCILALSANGSGINGQGNPSLNLINCSARSNASIGAGGSATMSAPDFYANGSINGSGITGTLHPNDGTVPDPYANDPAIQNAFANLSPGQGASFSVKPNNTGTLSPGTYSSWSIKGAATLQPGIYYVNGDISLGAQGSLSGNGVTIVTSGALSMQGGATLAISAAALGSTSGAIPGVVFAGTSTSSASFLGNTTTNAMTGVVYYPNGDLAFGGTAAGASSGCLEVIARSVTMKGNSTLAAKCATYGALSFGSDNSIVSLVR